MQIEEKLSPNEPQRELQRSLELKKLSLEIRELERPWWKRPAYVLGALPTVLAIVALSVGFLNGFFSAQLTKLENQKHDIELQIREFEATKKQLSTQNERLTKEKEVLVRFIEESQEELAKCASLRTRP